MISNLNLSRYQETNLSGRYIYNRHILNIINKYNDVFEIRKIGTSVLGEDIYVLLIGNGSKRVFMWSQMHGNESTSTKSVFDLLNFLNDSKNSLVASILDHCTIAIIPILNPDGAKAYTRENANNIDLNRDAKKLSQPESKVLREFYNTFTPDFCFNLHGQRTIFSAGYSSKPATVSFLSPAENKAQTVTTTRKKAMEIIVAMNTELQKLIPEQVGIYDDAFNINCVGDMFQSLGCPTILFEAGHFTNDYDREVVRALIFKSLVVAITYISKHHIEGKKHQNYFKIPKNEKLFYDIIIRNATLKDGDKSSCDIAIQYQEQLVQKELKFLPKIEKIGDLNGFFGHKEYNANGCLVLSENNKPILVGFENDFVMINNEKYSLKLTKS